MINIMQKYPEYIIEIGCHSDSVGSEAANLQLTESRATAIRNKLVSGGIAANRIRAKGFGETKPIASNNTREGRLQNRRVELRFSNNQ